MQFKPADKIASFINKILIKLEIEDQTRFAFIRYFFNTGWMFVEKVLLLVLSFFVGVYVARYLGPSQYGLLSYVFSFVFLFQAFSKLGLDGIVVRNLVQFPDKKHQILGTAIFLKSVASLLSLLILCLLIWFSESSFQTKLLILVVSISMIFSGFETAQFWFESQVQAKYNSMVGVFSGIVTSLIKIGLLILKAELIWFAAIFTVEILLKQTGYLIFYHFKNKDIFKLKFNADIAKDFLKDSWPLIISAIAVMLYLRIDQIMIKELLGDKETGLYSVAVSISEIWYFIPVVISSSVFPAIIDAKLKSKVLYEKRLQQLYFLMSIIAVLISIPIIIFGNEIIDILFGNTYSGAGIVLQIHIFSLLFVFWGQASGKWLLAENFVKLSMYRTLAGAVVNIIANIFLINEFGIVGAAYATLLSYMVAGYLFDIFYKKTRISFKMKSKSLNFLRILRYK